jgi:hypothetical protein
MQNLLVKNHLCQYYCVWRCELFIRNKLTDTYLQPRIYSIQSAVQPVGQPTVSTICRSLIFHVAWRIRCMQDCRSNIFHMVHSMWLVKLEAILLYNCHETCNMQWATCNKRLLQLPENMPAATRKWVWAKAELSVISERVMDHMEWNRLYNRQSFDNNCLVLLSCHSRRCASVNGCRRLLMWIFCARTKNANEPATSLQLRQNSGSSLLLVIWLL